MKLSEEYRNYKYVWAENFSISSRKSKETSFADDKSVLNQEKKSLSAQLLLNVESAQNSAC